MNLIQKEPKRTNGVLGSVIFIVESLDMVKRHRQDFTQLERKGGSIIYKPTHRLRSFKAKLGSSQVKLCTFKFKKSDGCVSLELNPRCSTVQ